MQYLKINSDGTKVFPFQPSQLRKDHPDVSFPKEFTDELLSGYGVFPVADSERPQTDASTLLVEGEPVNVNGTWVRSFDVVAKSAEQIESEYQQQAESIRSERNRLLSETDWTQLADSPVDNVAWITYRQALRDITNQGGFPFNVIFPTKP